MSGFGLALSLIVIPSIKREVEVVQVAGKQKLSFFEALQKFNPLGVFRQVLRPNILLAVSLPLPKHWCTKLTNEGCNMRLSSSHPIRHPHLNPPRHKPQIQPHHPPNQRHILHRPRHRLLRRQHRRRPSIRPYRETLHRQTERHPFTRRQTQ